MTYKRVIPRDLFNEASLLKCWGQLWLKLENRVGHKVAIDHLDDAPFDVEQSPADGSISLRNVRLRVFGIWRKVYRPLNSREPWPLYVLIGDDEVEVFDDDGELSEDFVALISMA